MESKKTRGRPRVNKLMRNVNIRISEKDYEIIKRCAEIENICMSAYIKKAVMDTAKK